MVFGFYGDEKEDDSWSDLEFDEELENEDDIWWEELSQMSTAY